MSQWELHDGTEQVGPLDEAHVIRMIQHGVPAATVVRRVGEADWKGLRSHAPFAVAMEQGATQGATPAPIHGQPPVYMPAQPPPSVEPKVATRVSRVPFVSVGCFVQGLGLLAPFALMPLVGFLPGILGGLITMLIFMIAGRVMSTEWTCGACRNRITKDATLCGACHAQFR